MNYVAGYLFLLFKDEQETFTMFHVVMNLYFKGLLSDKFEILKMKFYQIDRLISIFIPELSEHLK